jgi:isocitrate/isopropylmalate dehydrogenase
MTQPAATPRIPATLIPGDGIGEEIVDATLAALEALQAPFDWDRQIAGLGGVKASGDPLPPATLESIRRTRLALKGPLETPSGGGYRSSNVRLREEFQLYANLRPARTIIPGGRFDKVDLVVVRENLEGLYIGHEHYVKIDDDPHAVAMATGINTRAGSRRLLEYAFEHAVVTGRKKVSIVHKANIMKALTGIFLETGLELYEKPVQRQVRARNRHRRCLRDEAGAQPLAVRHAGHDQPVRRHPVRPGGRAGGRPGHGARCQTSAPMRRSSRRCTAPRRTSPARASPTRSR